MRRLEERISTKFYNNKEKYTYDHIPELIQHQCEMTENGWLMIECETVNGITATYTKKVVI